MRLLPISISICWSCVSQAATADSAFVAVRRAFGRPRSAASSRPSSSALSDAAPTDEGGATHGDGGDATTAVAGETFRAAAPSHLRTISERQVFHDLRPEQVFCASSRLCRHGHPQAFGFHPTAGPKPVSGLFRLSCPLLCEAIDAYEGEGGVRQVSDWLRRGDLGDGRGRGDGDGDDDDDDDAGGGWKRRGYAEANAAQARIRNALIDGDDGARDRLVARLGERNAEAFAGSGVAGVPPGQTYNVKCVHAHVADHLCRRGPSPTDDDGLGNDEGGNAVGLHALRILKRRGVPIDGSDACWRQCDVRHARGPEDWGYLARKNRSGLRRRGGNSRTRRFRPSDG